MQPQEDILEICASMEKAFPPLSECHNHWKAMKIIKQIIDNREDRNSSSTKLSNTPNEERL